MSRIDLDDANVYSKLDPSNMLRHLHDIPVLCQQTWEQVRESTLPTHYQLINKVVVLGMGGSAIGGDLLSSLIARECHVPIIVCREYVAPAFIDEQTLVIASSYSGTTEETLSAFKPLINQNCKKLVMSSGGELSSLAKKHGIPLFNLDYKCPPRAALYISFLSLLCIFTKLNLIRDYSLDLAETCALLRESATRIAEIIPQKTNPAKQLASRLHEKMVVIYGAEHLFGAAERWRLQINENSKSWAFCASFPELNHNSTTGYEVPKVISQNTHVVMLRSSLLHPRVMLRYSITEHILDQSNVQHTIVEAEGQSKLAQLVGLMHYSDYVSYFLSLLYEIDPYPINSVYYLKAELAKNG